MYLHLGEEILISGDNLIAIINISEPISPDLLEIADNAQLDKRLTTISRQEKNKSLVVCDDKVYLSPISSGTLAKRAIYFRGEAKR